MSHQHFFQPRTTDEAMALMAGAPLSWESPTQLRHRTVGSLQEAFGAGRRKPRWVWAAGTPDQPLGVVAGLGKDDDLLVLDFFGPPSDPLLCKELVAYATAQAEFADAPEACFFAPTDTAYDDPLLAPLADSLTAAGWRLLVERRHYEFAPYAGLAAQPTALRFETVTDATDPRLVACHREVMRGTLDAHDAALIERVGFEQACVESLAYLVTADPVECIRLAYDEAGEVVGMVSGLRTESGRGFVLFVGVPEAHRGHGHSRHLLAWITRALVADGAAVLIADTDNANVPMAAGFAAVGWQQTETRIDLALT